MTLKKITLRIPLIVITIVLSSVFLVKDVSAQNELDWHQQDSTKKTEDMLNFLSGISCTPEIEAEIQVRQLFSEAIGLEELMGVNRKDGIVPPEGSDDESATPMTIPQQVLDFIDSMKTKNYRLTANGKFLEYLKSDEYVDDWITLMYFYIAKDTPSDDKLGDLIKKDYFIWTEYGDSTVWKNRQGLRNMIFERNSIHEEIQKMLSEVPASYHTLKQLNALHGNPIITFSSEYSPNKKYGIRAHYFSGLNTICIGAGVEPGTGQHRKWKDYVIDYVAELSHAEQCKRYPAEIMIARFQAEYAYLDSVVKGKHFEGRDKDSLLINEDAIAYSKYLSKEYDKKMYTEPDAMMGYPTIEKEAHDEIEPEIWKEFEAITGQNKLKRGD